jgi:NADH-quinone oxidoreductase subunit I
MVEPKRSVKKKPPKPTGYILRPLWVTLKQTVRSTIHRPNTVLYPWEKLELPDGFRGRPGLIFDRCIGCGICVRICPNRCIELVEVDCENERVKRPQVNIGRCAMCGLCAEYCPTDAMIVTPEYELANTDKRALILDPFELSYEHRPGFEVHRHEVPASELGKGAEAKELRELGLKDTPELDDKLCIGCGICEKVCPINCIEMVEVGVNEKGKPIKRPRFDYSKCVSCENCVLACPKDALKMKEAL